MAKQQPKQEQQKLLKHISKNAELEAELQAVFPIKVFDLVELVCRRYLESARNDQPSRDLVARLAFQLRQETYARFGHDSLETFALGKLLRAAQSNWKQPAPRLDAISHVRLYKNKNDRFDAAQENAAEKIREVWDAFGKFRTMGGASYSGGGGGGRSQVLHPLDVMGEELWTHYCTSYKPWYNLASKVTIMRRRNTAYMSLAAIALLIVFEDWYPEQVDSSFGLPQSTALKALKVALSGYWELGLIVAFGNPKSAPAAGAGGRSGARAGKDGPLA